MALDKFSNNSNSNTAGQNGKDNSGITSPDTLDNDHTEDGNHDDAGKIFSTVPYHSALRLVVYF